MIMKDSKEIMTLLKISINDEWLMKNNDVMKWQY